MERHNGNHIDPARIARWIESEHGRWARERVAKRRKLARGTPRSKAQCAGCRVLCDPFPTLTPEEPR